MSQICMLYLSEHVKSYQYINKNQNFSFIPVQQDFKFVIHSAKLFKLDIK
jgi:uncharacterized protein YcgL (UPF0745 family)